MLNGDALLSFLAGTGAGSWHTFKRAVEDITGLNLHEYFAARALAARGLVEFDWLGNRSWSVPPLTIIRVVPGRLLGVGLIDDSRSVLLGRNGFVIAANAAIVTRNISYTRSEILAGEGADIASLEQMPEYFRIERSSLDAGWALLSALPQLGSIIYSRPLIGLTDAIGDGDVHFLDPIALTFDPAADRADSELNFQVLRVRRQFSAAEYYYVDYRGARRIELELALAYAAGRTGLRFLRYGAGRLAVDARVPIPILAERVLHFCGARFLGVHREAFGDRSYACYDGVSARIARIIAMKLLSALDELPALKPIAKSGGS